MSRRILIAIACAIIVLAGTPRHGSAADTPAAAVNKLHEVLLANMKDAAALEFEGRRERLAPVVQDEFDLETMARVSTGGAWRNMSEDERAGVIDAFTEWTIANYASQFDGFDGERFELTSEADAGRGNIMVNTEIQTKTETVALNYRLRQSGGHWRIIDIYMDGAVSQLAMRRGEFAAVLGKGDVGQLIDHMRAMASKLAAGG
jgi:phospholipid transport system substrate-binding protein